MRRHRSGWWALLSLLPLGMLAAARPTVAAGGTGAVVLVEEHFDETRPIPALGTYEKLPTDLVARVGRGERWHLIVGPGSAATAQVVGGVAMVRIQRAGMQWYAVQLAYLPVRLQPGRAYRVTFRSRAERSVFITFDLTHVGQGWHSYSGRKELELGRAWAEYEVRFTTGASESDEGARFEFNFGDETDVAAFIDDVRVVEERS